MAFRVLSTVLVVLYPGLVYYVLTQHDGRLGILGLLTLAIVLSVFRLKDAARERRAAVLAMPAALGILAGASLWLDDHRFVLAVPVLVNCALLITFASTLWEPTPLVERFARMQVDDLSPQEVIYCRNVTIVWCVFFVANGLTAGLLAWLASTAWWALYTGLLAYILVGTLGAAEYIVRKRRFGRYGDGLHDRILSRLLPAPSIGVTGTGQ